MCASYMIRQNTPREFFVDAEFKVEIEDYFDQVIRPYRPAPVLVWSNDHIELQAMQFSLVPSWSREPKVKFATHNARIESVLEKPTWREPFQRRHCVVLMTDFIEPIYEGDYAGKMVQFHRKDCSWLFAAGIWDIWTDPSTGASLRSFSILTTVPPKFVEEMGHDRCPIFLELTHLSQWLEPSTQPIDTGTLLKWQPKLELAIQTHRALKPGWEKRVAK